MRRLSALLVIVFGVAGLAACQPPPNHPVVFIQYPGWVQDSVPPNTIDYSARAIISQFGIIPTSSGGLDVHDLQCWCNIAPAVAAAHNAGKSIIVTIGEQGAGSAFVGATSPANIDAFVANIHNLVVQYGYDGVGIDWEESVTQTPYVTLVQKLRASLNTISTGFWLDIDVDTGQVPPAIAAAAAPSVSVIQDMTYQDSGISQQNAYIAAGIPANKLTLGIGLNADMFDKTQAAVQSKVDAAKAHGYAGVFAWSMQGLSSQQDPRLVPLRAYAAS